MTSEKAVTAIRGMYDILPGDALQWRQVEAQVAGVFSQYAYNEIRTPIVESTRLFNRAIGEATDIVEREMYSFIDSLNGEALTLRPEGTASCVRAVLQHSLCYNDSQRLWYSGPMFRHERPQKGRARQFHQIGAEAFGYAGPHVDVEQIAICSRLWNVLEIAPLRLEINTLGTPESRSRFRAVLVDFLRANKSQLDADSLRRLDTNPLRILDSKNDQVQAVVARAPSLIDYLDQESLGQFERVKESLEELGISFLFNPRLVRGLDYYSHLVYEWKFDALGAQGTVCARGRYDGLSEQLGGPPLPGCGFAMGLERIFALKELNAHAALIQHPDVFVVASGSGVLLAANRVAEQIRDLGLGVQVEFSGTSFRSQMKRASQTGARFAVIIGETELGSGTVAIKRLDAGTHGTGGQQQVSMEQAGTWILAQQAV